ncbi:MAG: MtrB/PioB family decaheme-associated outer membrane protein [Xanthobacteraceae bacterium]
MSNRFRFVQACVVGAVMLGGTALVSTDAFAQCCQGGGPTGANAFTDGLATSAAWPADPWLWPVDNASLLKAPPVAPFWWTHGEIEVGGRDFLNNPQTNGSIWGDTNPANFTTGGYAFVGGQSLAKYYEYSIVAPGAFGGGHVATGTSDGLYQIDLWANNIGSYFQGFSDQSYMLTASKAGEQYFTFIWDQTPHVYSTSAQTIFNGVGTNNLTVPAGLVANPVSTATVGVNKNTGAAAGGILPYLYPIDVGIQRNTAAVIYRATDPWMAWDAGADYSYMTRTGTQPAGIVEMSGFQPTYVPAPVDDSTQNFGAKGEYIGTSLWGQKFTFKVAYTGSIYTDNISSYTVQNPFFPTVGSCTKPSTTAAGTANCGSAQMSTWPSNQMNGISETTSAELPFNSRYVGTTSGIMMTQNAAFQPMTNNPLAVASPNGVPWNQVGALPVQSLGGDINTLLSNNVLTTQITPTLTSKLNYRYYNFDNNTPQIVFPCWISYDGTGATITKSATANPCGGTTAAGTGFEGTLSSLSISYVKQDAGAEMNWRPTKEWNVNAAYGYERYDYTQADATATNENSVKASVDWKPTSWLTTRATGYYANRTAENYSYLMNVAAIQFPTVGNYTPTGNGFYYSPAYQQFFLDNRQRTKADFLVDLVALPGVTITPSFKYKDDYYGLNPVTQDGVSDQKMLSGGVDVAWVVTPTLSIVASYYYEYYHQLLYSASGIPHTGGYAGPPPPPASAFLPQITTTDTELVNTVTAAIRWAAVPNTFDIDARYTGSFGVDEQVCSLCTGTIGTPTGGTIPAGTPFPNNNTYFQRVDVTGTYRFDPTWVQQMGFKGDLLFRLRYTWESNSVTNWQNDALAPFTDISGMTNAIWMAYDNPNYNVQILSASLIARW